jgi:hypothetical protein
LLFTQWSKNMKRLGSLFALFFLIVGCGEDPDPDRNTKLDEVQDVVTVGRWRISYFLDSDKDETADFAEYVFQFQPSGALIATDGPTSLTGSWAVTEDSDSNDDIDTYEDIDFDISFVSSPVLSELTEDWEIIAISNTKIELKHISGGNGSTDLLTFDKI